MLKRKGFFSIFLILLLVFIYFVVVKDHPLQPNLDPFKSPQLEMPQKSDDMFNIDLYSSNAILVSLEDHTILLDKNSEEIIYPASLTKLMTVLVALENIPDLNEKIILKNRVFTNLYEENASMAGFLPNEEVTAEDLLYGAMLPSGAEASIGLAESIAGSESGFAQLMNEKAQQLGMTNSHFMNATGLHHPDHYTTVKDLSILLQSALVNPIFREVYTAERYSIKSTNRHPEGITLTSRLFNYLNTNQVTKGKIIGGKTGYTEQAGLCLASLASINGEEYLLVTVGAEGDPRSEQFNITDALAVYQKLY